MTKDQQIKNAAAALESLANTTGANALDLLNVLCDWAWDKEDAGKIREYLEAGPAPDLRDEQKGRLVQLQKERNHALDCCDRQSEQIKVLRHELYRAAEAFKALGMKINEADAREALALTAPAKKEEGDER